MLTQHNDTKHDRINIYNIWGNWYNTSKVMNLNQGVLHQHWSTFDAWLVVWKDSNKPGSIREQTHWLLEFENAKLNGFLNRLEHSRIHKEK